MSSDVLFKIIPASLLDIAAVAYCAGLVTTVLAGPCSDIGAYILMSSVALAGFSTVAFLTRACMVRTTGSWGAFLLALSCTLVGAFFGYMAAVLLCRGV